MKRLGWYSRLCLILSVWWLVIGTVWIFNGEYDAALKFDEALYGICNKTADTYAQFDAAKGIAESDRCMRELTDRANEHAAHVGSTWLGALAVALIANLAALIVALAAYWSVRFILAGKRNNRFSVLTKATDIR